MSLKGSGAGHHREMIVMLRTHRVRTLDQVRSFLDDAEPVEVRPLDRNARYELVAQTLRRFEPLGYVPPAEFEAHYDHPLQESAMAA